jgi:hypothetical protein
LLASFAATAQEVVHALVGTITSINSNAKTIGVRSDDGAEGQFKDMLHSHYKIPFDKNSRTDAAAADSFKNSGERAIVYYFGVGDLRTIVALRSLGPGPYVKSAGKVVSFNKKERSLTITTQSGQQESFEIPAGAVVDTEMGAVGESDFRPATGDPVRLTAVVVNGTNTALFVSTLAAD